MWSTSWGRSTPCCGVPTGRDDGCACRKPAPGLIHAGATACRVPVERCVVVGDIGADVEAARAAGARSILVPTDVTLADEVVRAPCLAPDFGAAADRVLATRERRVLSVPGTGVTGAVLVARLDNAGDVLLAGPAVRAAAATGRRVHLLCGPRGRAAADLLPGVDEVIEWHAPWIEAEPMAVDRTDAGRLVARVRAAGVEAAAVLGSSHQSPLPLALLLRWAGVARIAAVSHDHAGSLLDVRIPGDPDVHEVQRGLLVTEALGFPAPHRRPLGRRSRPVSVRRSMWPRRSTQAGPTSSCTPDPPCRRARWPRPSGRRWCGRLDHGTERRRDGRSRRNASHRSGSWGAGRCDRSRRTSHPAPTRHRARRRRGCGVRQHRPDAPGRRRGHAGRGRLPADGPVGPLATVAGGARGPRRPARDLRRVPQPDVPARGAGVPGRRLRCGRRAALEHLVPATAAAEASR